MTLSTLSEPSAAQQQKDAYNRSGPTGITTTYTPSAGTAWAVLGLVLDDAFDPSTEEGDLVTALEALSPITSVSDPRINGQAPSTVQMSGHEFRVVVSTTLVCTIHGYSGGFRKTRDVKPPVGKKFMVVNCRVSAEPTTAGISALETAVEGLADVTSCHHLVSGLVHADATGISMQVETKMRIDPTEA